MRRTFNCVQILFIEIDMVVTVFFLIISSINFHQCWPHKIRRKSIQYWQSSRQQCQMSQSNCMTFIAEILSKALVVLV